MGLRLGTGTLEICTRLEPLESLSVVNELYNETLPDVLFVSYDGDSVSLSKTIGFGDDEKVGTGVILRVTYRNGYAPRPLWEWLDNHE